MQDTKFLFMSEALTNIAYARLLTAGNCDAEAGRQLIAAVNGRLLCFVAAALQHALERKRDGAKERPMVFGDTTRAGKHMCRKIWWISMLTWAVPADLARFWGTWVALPEQLRTRILKSHQFKLRTRLDAAKARHTPVTPDLAIREERATEAELGSFFSNILGQADVEVGVDTAVAGNDGGDSNKVGDDGDEGDKDDSLDD